MLGKGKARQVGGKGSCFMSVETVTSGSGAKAAQAPGEAKPYLEVENLKMYFPITEGIFIQKKVAEVKAVDDISFTMRKGETLGLVGESGCGKLGRASCREGGCQSV